MFANNHEFGKRNCIYEKTKTTNNMQLAAQTKKSSLKFLVSIILGKLNPQIAENQF